jgi:glycosyltransferase involved in cell wall biosynthesis
LQVVHTLQRAGAEQLVYELAEANRDWLETAVVCLDEEGPLAEELKRVGVPVYFTRRRPGVDWGQISKIGAIIREFNPGVIHCHQYTPFFYGGLAAWRTPIGRVLFTEHGRHWPDVVGWKRRLFNRWLGRRADRMTAVCEFAKSRLMEKEGFSGDRIEVVYNGVEAERFEGADREAVRAELDLPKDARVVIQVGTFRAVKDQATAIRAFGIVRRRDENAVLMFAGDGPDLAACKELAAELGLSEAVVFLGQRGDVPRILSAADVMLMTSLSEAHSVSLLEGMASRLPIVATDVGGNAETVVHGETGLLAGDAEEIAAALLELLGDETKRRRMGQAGYERVKERFSRQAMHRRYLEIYRELA